MIMSINIKVLGTGCANCKTTLKLIEEVAAEKGVTVQLEKVEDIQAIMSHGVMSTPGVVIDGKVVHAGGVPTRDKIAAWLVGSLSAAEAASAGACCSGGKCC
jgi:small redox-active disulfide protein 2